ncbi:methyltransferase domain-containing protein [Streptomyces sp. HSW2009]|uniref:protein-L-isoaspartate O-methyltransferase family protein n=1 Tax=Streptomyces sp. HSW2009 TaxID=3142890 RepID=UPI0032EF9E1B
MSRRTRLATAMTDAGLWPADSPWVRPAMVEAAPRHLFAPDRLWTWDGHAYVPLDRTAAPDRWTELVYGGPYDSTVTQVTDGLPTSSLSCEAVVADMLDSAMLEPGHAVLELGAATGRNAALMAARTGHGGRVVTVEVDPQLADGARQNLAAAHADVVVVTGDGARGAESYAPFDRVMATYAVDLIPWNWVQQTRPGGRIVTPWGRLGHVALTVAADGRSARGWVQGLATFMPAKGTVAGRPWEDVRGAGEPEEETVVERTDLLRLHKDANLLFALRVVLPEVQIRTEAAEGRIVAWVHDGRDSWTTLVANDGHPTLAYQGGPRRLATELQAAGQDWERSDAPSVYDFGMTCTADHQVVWSGDPNTGRRWSQTSVHEVSGA